MKVKIEFEVTDVEGTRSPYWIIVDPRQNFRCDAQAVHDIARMITGVFFSREEAQAYLDNNSHHFTSRAKVYCHSGYYSRRYDNAWRDADK